MKGWIKELIDEYPTKRSQVAIVRLVRVYSKYSDETMRLAVDRYMLNEYFFPKVANLRQYVNAVLEDGRGDIAYHAEGERVRYGRWLSQESQAYSDQALYDFELSRDTVPELDEAHDYWTIVFDATHLEIEAELPY